MARTEFAAVIDTTLGLRHTLTRLPPRVVFGPRPLSGCRLNRSTQHRRSCRPATPIVRRLLIPRISRALGRRFIFRGAPLSGIGVMIRTRVRPTIAESGWCCEWWVVVSIAHAGCAVSYTALATMMTATLSLRSVVFASQGKVDLRHSSQRLRLDTRMCGQCGAASGRVVGAIPLEQNDEWAVQRAHYMTWKPLRPCAMIRRQPAATG